MSEKKSSKTKGTATLCRVCGDIAYGLHYGVHSCKRCIRFFKRSIIHSAQYKPCKYNQQCSIFWYNRKKCHSCHLNKCIAVGMFTLSARKGVNKSNREKPNIHATMKKVNVPSEEMQEILAAMQKVSVSKSKHFMITRNMKKWNILEHENSKLSTSIKKVNIPERKKSMIMDSIQNVNVPNFENPKILTSGQNQETDSLNENMCAELEEEFKITEIIKKAHEDTCDITKEKVAALLEKAQTSYGFSQLVCPLNTTLNPNNKDATYCKKELFERFSTKIQGVIEFSKRIPCFESLSQWDQDILLKAGVFEVLLVRLAYFFNTEDNSLLCFYGPFLHRDSLILDKDSEFFLKSIFDFSERMNNLHLSDNEVALFSSILLIAADHPGLKNPDTVLIMQNKLIRILQRSVSSNHIENPDVFNDLMKIIPVIRILNCLHSKKRMAYEMEPGICNLAGTVGQIIEILINANVSPYGNETSSTHLDNPSHVNLPVGQPPSEEGSNSPGLQSNGSGSSTISYEWSTIDSIDSEELVLSPISMWEGDSNSSLMTSCSSSSASYEYAIRDHSDSQSGPRNQPQPEIYESDSRIISRDAGGFCGNFPLTLASRAEDQR